MQQFSLVNLVMQEMLAAKVVTFATRHEGQKLLRQQLLRKLWLAEA